MAQKQIIEFGQEGCNENMIYVWSGNEYEK